MEVAAVTLARQANAAAEEGDWRRASELYAATAQQAQPDTQGWARAVYHAWNARCHASSCDNFFCRCNGCVALPEMPEWMKSPQSLMAIAARVVAAEPAHPDSWVMNACVNPSTASQSWRRAAKLYQESGNAGQVTHLRYAKSCLEQAQGGAGGEQAQEAMIMAKPLKMRSWWRR